MNELLGALRAVHIGCAMLLFGEAVFALAVRPPPDQAGAVRWRVDRRFLTVARWSLAALVVSAIAWLIVQAAAMSGLPLAEAATLRSIGLVLGSTVFGAAFSVRAVLVVALAIVLVAWQRRQKSARSREFMIIHSGLAAALLGSLAWTGHAVAGDPSEAFLRIGADVAHLLAAGAWIGALPALVFHLGSTVSPQRAAMAGRFSRLGVASVGVLAASGLVNAWYQVGGIPGLVGTGYGRLLVVKLAIFGALLCLAAMNRGLAAGALDSGGGQRLHRLRVNAIGEIALGAALLAVLAPLGTSVPAIHDPVVWPFDATLELAPIRESAWQQVVVAAAAVAACAAAAVLVAGAIAWPPRLSIGAAAGVVASLALIGIILAVPAYPTTYQLSPVPFSAQAVATGAASYDEHCSRCHGHDGAGASLDLRELVPERREGDLFWTIAHGLPEGRMPAFGSQLSAATIWRLTQFLDAQVAARNALALSDRLRPSLPVPAPDFAYEIPGMPQQSLRQQEGNQVALLVFYSLPSSLARLRDLAALEPSYAKAGARVIALPMLDSPAASAGQVGGAGVKILASAGPAVARAYRLFAGKAASRTVATGAVANGDGVANGSTGAGNPRHIEYLVDRFGLLRSRATGLPGAQQSDAMLAKVETLARETREPPALWAHRH